LKALRIEAHSLQRYKEVSYKLENKVIELTQDLTAKVEEIKSIEKEKLTLEQQILYWQEKYNTEKEHRIKLEEEVAQLKSEKEKQEEEYQQELKNIAAENQAKITEIKKEKHAQKASLDQALETITKLEAESQKLNSKIEEREASDRKLSQTGEMSLPQLHRENETLNAQLLMVLKQLAIMKEHNIVLDPGLVSLLKEKNFLENQEAEKRKMERERSRDIASLVDEIEIVAEAEYQKEIVNKLILQNKPPVLVKGKVNPREQILYPAHIIGLVFRHMFDNNLFEKLPTFMTEVMHSIQAIQQKAEDTRSLVYWLSNVDELRAIVSSFDPSARKDQRGVKVQPGGPKSLSKVMNDITLLAGNLVYQILKRTKDYIEKMVVSAILEHEGLPGVKRPRALLKTPVHSGPQFTPQILLIYLGELTQYLNDFYLQEELAKSIMGDIIYYINASAFNNLLVRKDLCTSRRGVQIQYNVTQIEQWCTQQGFSEVTMHLSIISQAAKLLQLKMRGQTDIDFVLDFCFLLNPTQIHKILSMYRDDETEKGVPPALLEYVSRKVVKTNEELTIDTEANRDFAPPPPKTIMKINKYLPADLTFTSIKIHVD